ncbi:hypothetical protein FCL40_17120 [Ferrimonas sediminicola]|uniref:Uncharacterized protein n=1 Tax=Ferrimonas sediminicola TaxID=2569538 RepID=A0A4V6WML5_9GAMM|nr:hypothetical protein [Ferrimonas sediminicola]TKB46777.1 hypothetical protein FCL40_17120 [Ferrimonas sediminicola]
MAAISNNDARKNAMVRLLCGQEVTPSEETGDFDNDLDKIIAHLSSSIENICDELAMVLNSEDRKLSFYGPYLGRAMLELGMTCLVARIDPFRVLVMKGKQVQTNYDLGKPHSSSMKWQGDVVDEDVNDLWSDKSLKNPTRALLGRYQTELTLISAAEKMIDDLEESIVGEKYDLLTGRDAVGHIGEIKSKTNRCFSSFSKGIHQELLVPIDSLLDRDTVVGLLNDAFYVLSTLGLIMSHVPYAYNNCNVDDCQQMYSVVEDIEVQEHAA